MVEVCKLSGAGEVERLSAIRNSGQNRLSLLHRLVAAFLLDLISGMTQPKPMASYVVECGSGDGRTLIELH
jgi:hypothetical protein